MIKAFDDIRVNSALLKGPFRICAKDPNSNANVEIVRRHDVPCKPDYRRGVGELPPTLEVVVTTIEEWGHLLQLISEELGFVYEGNPPRWVQSRDTQARRGLAGTAQR
jgi:hypothetical protein